MQKKVTHIVQPNDKLKLCVSKSIYYIKRNYLKQLKKKNLNEKKHKKYFEFIQKFMWNIGRKKNIV